MTSLTKKRIVVIGGGFAGLNFVKHLDTKCFDVILVDSNNYHSFPPLFYQVASSGLDPSSICFPLRHELRRKRNPGVKFNLGSVETIDTVNRTVHTSVETINYNILVVAAGTTNNFFNMPALRDKVFTMKSAPESIRVRNEVLALLEHASVVKNQAERRKLLSFIVVGGGPSGVEIAGALGEMKRYVLPREYPSINQDDVSITIIEGNNRLLRTMSEQSSAAALKALSSLMVDVRLGVNLKDYNSDTRTVELADGTTLPAAMVIWTAGITASPFRWITTDENNQGQPSFISRGGRLKTDSHCAVESLDGVYAIGDISIMSEDPAFPDGHPQLAQVALQQGKLLAHNLNNLGKGSDRKPKQFIYKDKGSMATIGRNRAVVDLRHLHFHGFAAWMVWMFIHLISLLGMRNRLTVLINWVWAYFNYSTSLRLLIRPARHPSAGETSLFKSE